MRRVLAFAILLGCLVACPNYSEARGPYGSIKVGAWKGGAYTNDKTGAFTHCAAGAPYLSGIYFMVLVDAGLDWALGFANDKWSVTNGQVFQIALTFDGQTPFNVQGVALSESLVRVPMPSNSSLIAQFRKAKSMTAFTQGQLFQFKLDQTAQLLPTLANCVAKVKEVGVSSAGDFSLPPPPPNQLRSPWLRRPLYNRAPLNLRRERSLTKPGPGLWLATAGTS